MFLVFFGGSKVRLFIFFCLKGIDNGVWGWFNGHACLGLLNGFEMS